MTADPVPRPADGAAPMQSGRTGRNARLAVAGTLLALLGIYAWRYLPYFGDGQANIGTDYAYFLPHLLAGDFWFAANGPFTVPWMTPAFCGGVPFYANPQSFYYSPAQLLSLVVSPLRAVKWTILLYAALGAAGMYLLLRRSFRASVLASLLGATIFLFNGFFSHRMLIGHFAFGPFMLAPVLAMVLVDERSELSWMTNGLAGGVLLALMFQAGMVVLLPQVLLIVIWFGLLHAIRAGAGRHFLLAFGTAGLTAAPLCAAKLVAAAAFLSHFSREYYPLPGIPRFDLLVVLTARMLFSHAGDDIRHFWTNRSILMNLHEWEYGLSPVPMLLIIPAAVVSLARRLRPGAGFPRSVDMRYALLALLFAVPLLLNYYTPGWNAFLRQIPIVNGSQSLSRWFAFYIPVFSLLAGLAFDALGGIQLVRVGVWLTAMAVAVSFHVNEDVPATDGEPSHIPQQAYSPTEVEEGWRYLHVTGNVPPVVEFGVRLVDGRPTMVDGENGLAHGVSNLYCYEPLFGYDLKKFPRGAQHMGGPLIVDNGAFNLKDPACFVYPDENGCKPGDQMPATRHEDATAFLGYHPLRWKVPFVQTLANVLNLLALVATPVLVAMAWRRERRGH